MDGIIMDFTSLSNLTTQKTYRQMQKKHISFMARSHLIGNKLRLLQSCNKSRRYIRQHYFCKRRQNS